MKTGVLNGKQVVLGHIFPLNELRVGSLWQQADGTDRTVQIRAIEGNCVHYGTYAGDTTYCKDYFSFQTRYCLIVDCSNV